MYEPISNCSGQPSSVGITADWDAPSVLACKAHFGRLRTMDARAVAPLERDLRKAFHKDGPAGAQEHEDGVVLLLTGPGWGRR
jgi:hypothetical protein